MNCERCSGLMALDRHTDYESQDPAQPWLELWRCTTCGNVVDALILVNRMLQRILDGRRAKFRQVRQHGGKSGRRFWPMPALSAPGDPGHFANVVEQDSCPTMRGQA